MNFFDRFFLACISWYLRRAPSPMGRWRFVKYFLPLLREHGKDLGERVVSTRYDFRYKADLGDWLGQYVYLTGVYEPPTARVIGEILETGDTFIDIGANSGFFTLLASRRVGSHGKVLAFEPIPSMRKRLAEGISLNAMTNVSVEGVAVSNAEGTLPLFEGPEGHKGISSLRPIENAAMKIQVETLPLDTFEAQVPGVKLIKIDVEGAEQLVLDGMSRILDHYHPYIVIEVTDGFLRAFGHDAIQLARHLTSKGYRMYEINPAGLKPMLEEHAADITQFNALFAHGPVPEQLLASIKP